MKPRLPPLSESNPDVAATWHPTLNGDLTPANITRGASNKIWWQCPQGHAFESVIAGRVKSMKTNPRGCPVCSNQTLVPGINDLATLRPKLASEWHPTKNGDLKPSDVFPRAKNPVWWQCSQGHDWKVAPNNKEEGACAICSSQIFVSGVNDLETLYPHLAKEWHPTKNDKLKPSDVPPRYAHKVWWMCEQGHEWQTSPDNRVSKRGCTVCSNRKVVVSINDLATTHPKIAEQWHPTKNGNRTPYNTPKTSGNMYWWLCPAGHEWQATPNSRRNPTDQVTGCAICSNKKVLAGFNDLATTHPHIAAQWHPNLNGQLLPSMVTAGSGLQVYWLCKKGHSWRTVPASRTGKNPTGCRRCAAFAASRIETEFHARLAKVLVGLKHLKRIKHKDWTMKSRTMEVDMYVQLVDAKIVIEYDGSYWHKKHVERDTLKSNLLITDGYTVIRIREQGLPSLPITSDRYVEFTFKHNGYTEAHKKEVIDQVLTWITRRHSLGDSLPQR